MVLTHRQRQESQARLEQQPPEVLQPDEALVRSTGLLDLPTEILLEIVRCFVYSHKTEVEKKDDLYAFGIHTFRTSKPSYALPQRDVVSWLYLSHVCRHLRDLVLHDPVLWADQWLQGIPWTEYSLKRIPSQLPLNIKGGMSVEVEHIRAIMSHSAQIQSLDLRYIPGVWHALRLAEWETYKFPLLDTLKLACPYRGGALSHVPQFLVNGLSQVSSLMLNNVNMGEIPLQSSNLRILSIIYHSNTSRYYGPNTTQYYHHLINGLPNLESFELTGTLCKERVAITTNIVTHPRLRTLRLCLPFLTDYVEFLTPLRLPQCTSANVQIQEQPDEWPEVVEALRFSQIFRDPVLAFHCDGVPVDYVQNGNGLNLRFRMWTEPVAFPFPNTSPCTPSPRLTVQLSNNPSDPLELLDITRLLPLASVRTVAIYNVDAILETPLREEVRPIPRGWPVGRTYMHTYNRCWIEILSDMPHITHLHVAGTLCHIVPACLLLWDYMREPILNALETLCVDDVNFVANERPPYVPGDDSDSEEEYDCFDENEQWVTWGDVSLEMLADSLQSRERRLGCKVKKLVFGRNVSRDADCAPVGSVLASIRQVVDEVVDHSLEQISVER